MTLAGTSNRTGTQWSQTSGRSVTLSSTTSLTPTFRAPNLTASYVLRFRLSYGSTSDTVAITVNANNDAPSANAGANQIVRSQAATTLSGSGSDPEGSSLSYAWTQTGGSPTVALSDAGQASASFTAPTVTADTVLEFTLVVTDAGGQTATGTVDVTVTPPLRTVQAMGLSLASRPLSGDTYKQGETIRAQVWLSGLAVVSGSPQLALGIGSRTRTMSYVGLDRARVLEFEYTVQASDEDTDGVSIGSGALSLPSGTSLVDEAGETVGASLSGYAVANESGHKVDGDESAVSPIPDLNACPGD